MSVKAAIAKADGKASSAGAPAAVQPQRVLPTATKVADAKSPAPAPAKAQPPAAAAPAPPGGAATAARPRVTSAAPSASSAATAANANAGSATALADGLTFVEKDCIASVQALVEILQRKQLQSGPFRKCVGFVVKHLQSGTLPAEVKEGIAADATMYPVFTGVYDLLSCAVRTRIKDKEFASELNKIQIPAPYFDDLVLTLTTYRDSLFATAQAKRIALPTVTELSWRVDVAVSTTALSRVFKPAIVMQLTLSDNTIKTFECSVEKFHELRYNVAKLLKSMQDVEQHPTLLRVE